MAGLTCTLCHLLSLTGQERLTATLKLHLLVDIQETRHELPCPSNLLPALPGRLGWANSLEGIALIRSSPTKARKLTVAVWTSIPAL